MLSSWILGVYDLPIVVLVRYIFCRESTIILCTGTHAMHEINILCYLSLAQDISSDFRVMLVTQFHAQFKFFFCLLVLITLLLYVPFSPPVFPLPRRFLDKQVPEFG